MPKARCKTSESSNPFSAPKIGRLAACLLLLLLFAQAMRGAVAASISFDEGPHLAVGYATLRTGDFRLQPVHIHPPLTNILAAAPLLLDPSLPNPRTIDGWDIASLSAVTDTIIWQHRPPDGLALAGRAPIILLAILLGTLVYRWAADLAGPKAGLLALFLYALDPNIVAHAQVITTDMGVTVFGFAAFYLYFKTSSPGPPVRAGKLQKMGWVAGAGITLGAALATKVSAMLLAPFMAVIILLTPHATIPQRIARMILVGLIAFGVVWAAYGFEMGRIAGAPVPIPAATHVKIYQSLQQHYDEGHSSFLMGMNSTRGWWYYFLIAFLVKTPLPVLILLVTSVGLWLRYWVLGIRKWRLDIGDWRCGNAQWIILGLFPVVHFGAALFSSVDIGYRHLLPILPFIFVFIGVQISGFGFSISDFRFRILRHVLRFTFYLLLLWYALSAASIFPHNLAYFNELAGGPDNGYTWLVDSNLDWGQNLKELKAWLDARGIEHVFISQFSPSRPEVYGLNAAMLPPSPRAAPLARFEPAPGWYAIGATTLQGAYMPDADTFAYFRTLTPTARIGHALFVYDIPPSDPIEWVAVCANPAPVLSDDEITAGFGRDDFRRIYLDCTQSWLYPANNAPGQYIIPPGAERPPDTKVQLQGRHSDGSPAYAAYRIKSRIIPEQMVNGLPVWPLDDKAVDAPLTPLGYWVNRAAACAGETIEMWTIWKVQQAPNRPLSLMAHLAGPDGRPIAVGDGLGVPIEQWRPGDVIVQRHKLPVPPDTPPGSYSAQMGAYWLDTMERWPMQSKEGSVRDHLNLTTVTVTE